MNLQNTIVSRVPRPSRAFQTAILNYIEYRFKEIVEESCVNLRQARHHLSKSKALLLDIRHVILYQSFDHDIREKIILRTDAIVNYINAYMNSFNRKIFKESENTIEYVK